MDEREHSVEIEDADIEDADEQRDDAARGDDDDVGPDTEVEILGVVGDDGEVEEEVGGGMLGDDGGEVAALRREIADLRDRSMRTLADFDNYRKRAERERAEIRRQSAGEVIRDFLEVNDNLERALAAGGSADDLRTGVDMILRQFAEVLRRHGVERVPAVGERFDPAIHDAVSRLEDPEVEAPQVVEELQAGYRYQERLLRPSRVVVAVPAEES